MTNKDYSHFLKNCLEELHNAFSAEVYLVGGFIREWLQNNQSWDLDFVTSEDTTGPAGKLAKKTGGAFVPLDPERKTSRVVWNTDRNGAELNFDLAVMDGKDLQEDLQRRDLTVNALALKIDAATIRLIADFLPLPEGLVIDPSGGLADFRQKKIRTFRPGNLAADPLRMLRVFRFSAKLNFEVEPETYGFIKENAARIIEPAKERVLKELLDILNTPGSSRQLKLMADCRILDNLFGPVPGWEKVLRDIEILEGVIKACQQYFEHHREISRFLNENIINYHTRAALLKFVLLVSTRKNKGESGGFMSDAEALLKEFTFSVVEQKLILKVLKLLKSTEILSLPLTRKNLYLYFREAGQEAPSALLILLVLNYPDDKCLGQIQNIMHSFYEDRLLSEPPLIVDGREIMAHFGLKPGRLIGELLELVRAAQAEKKVGNREEILSFVGDYLKNRPAD